MTRFAVDFDPLGPLPRRRTAIEASAGTGKTHALATLVTRFVAEEGVSAAELLVVSFTRAAANELRAKVRRRLALTADLLEGRPASGDADAACLVTHLAGSEQTTRVERLRRAVVEFDAATVTTIHGFAFQARAALGTGSGAEPADRLLADRRRLLREACNDVLAGAASGPEAEVGLPDLGRLVRLAERLDARPDLDMFPGPSDGEVPRRLALLGELVRRSASVAQRRRRAGGMVNFDDLLTGFRRVLLDDSTGQSAARYLGARYRVVLVDEFQDTDPVQWDILSALFGHAGDRSTLVVVGDPKQSIFGFRGADVHTYRRAVDDPGTDQRVLRTNWRADEALLDALSALLSGATFGEDIEFRPVEAAPGRSSTRLLDAAGRHLPAISLRLATNPAIRRRTKQPQFVTVDAARAAIVADLCASLRALLVGGRLPASDAAGVDERVRPRDVAVLVSTNRVALDVQAALRRAGIPAVVTRAESVLQSEAASHLRWLLHAMDRPSDLALVRLAALSWFGGWTARQVAAAGDDDAEGRLAAFQDRLRGWADGLFRDPVAAVLTRIRSESGCVARLLGRPDGDRVLTDLDHLVELLGTVTPSGRSGPALLLEFLEAPPDPATDGQGAIDEDEDLTARRLETDADCVQVMTTWTAKGLEFPIVCLPMLWQEPNPEKPDEYFDRASGRQTLDLTVGSNGFDGFPDAEAGAGRRRLVEQEADAERLRVLYVALTRARHLNLVWWARTPESECSALARVLFARREGRIDPDLFSAHRVPVPPDERVATSLQALVQEATRRHADAMTVEEVPEEVAGDPWCDGDADGPAAELGIALAPTPDRRYRRWSFSYLAARRADELVDPQVDRSPDAGADDWPPDEGAEPEAEDGEADLGPPPPRPVGSSPTGGSAAGERGVNPMADLAGGSALGTLVHSVLERTDWQAPDLETALADAVDDCLGRRPVELELVPTACSVETPPAGRQRLVAGLRTALQAPLGGPFGGRRLVDLGTADRVAELTFDVLVGTGAETTSTRELGRAVRDGLPPDDPCRPWAAALADDPRELPLAGNLTGSIDLVARVAGAGGEPRFVLADYKTNALHAPGAVPTACDYAAERLGAAMAEHDYPLQALLYSVALHRYLRWRLPGYDPERHLGGVAYLFLRGMDGRSAPGGSANGVFTWRVPPPLVEQLSELLDGSAPRAGTVGVPG